jgi:hypothetical protein
MSIRTSVFFSLSLFLFVSTGISAEERMFAGAQRGSDLVMTGAKDVVTSPVRIFTEIGEETKNFGAFGVVGGGVRGPIKAGGQALRGGFRMAIGVLDVLFSPFTPSPPE